MIGGPLGVLLGVAVGHQFDRGLKLTGTDPRAQARLAEDERIQAAFFTATFSVMGHLVRVDGRVSEPEIALARAMMAHMRLSAEQRETARRLFTEGKRADFPLNEVLGQLRRECCARPPLLRTFIEIQLQAAYADGSLNNAEQRLLLHIAETLGYSRSELQHLEAWVRAQQFFREQARGTRMQRRRPEGVKDAYTVLGIRSDATDAEVKIAYRRLINQHHPDKLAAKDLPEEMIKLAAQKTREIRAAYDRIREARGS
jgi:DnaJ-domain-containing proteins 1